MPRRRSPSPTEEEETEEQIMEEISSSESEEDELAAIQQADTDEEDEEEAESDNEKIEQSSEDDEEQNEVARRERERLRLLKKRKREELDKIRSEQNAEVQADMKTMGKQKMKFLLQQTQLFSHFAQQGGTANKSSGLIQEEDELIQKEDDQGEDEGDGEVTRLVAQPSCIKGTLRAYQLAGLNWLIRLYDHGINGILADEMGLGKTLQTISLLGYLHEYRGIKGPHMVVAPKSTLGNWMNEIRKFCPVLRAFKFHGTKEEKEYQRQNELTAGKFDVCVTSFEVAMREKSALKRFSWRYIIIDEAHRIKNENSALAKTMRQFITNNRLLITGTPLQNNLHELWALLNYLVPEIFISPETFDDWFKVSENEQKEIVQKLHEVLRPFLLRRLKVDVERDLPPKKETILKVGMSQMQKDEYKALLQKDVDALHPSGERRRLLNIAMQLRKCCNHPYLFPHKEPGPPYFNGEHLVENSGKMVLLDKLLPKLKNRDSRVLLFSQMTRLLDILEDYCALRGYKYCRIDGKTSGEDREAAIETFNTEGSDKFIFLLSTRAGGLGINLATADVVILYDSDWNPQADLQAQDRAHRIGQKKEVQVFRFCTEHTIEEKVIERAYKKLALDAVVIQQGRLTEQKSVNKDELFQMVQFGAEMVFTSKGSTITDEDVDLIIQKGELATAELNAKMKKFSQDAFHFKMDDPAQFDTLDDKKEERKDLKKIVAEHWDPPSARPRKRNYSESDDFKQAHNSAKPRELRIPKMPQLHEFQFFNRDRLNELYEKEVRCQYLQKENGKKDILEYAEPLTAEEQEEKEQLLKEGFSTWNRRDFQAFLRASEKFGRGDIKSIAGELEGKTEEEVERYASVFNARYKELSDHDKIIKAIEKGESRLVRKDEIMQSIRKKMECYRNPLQELKIQYGQNKGKLYTEECDRFMICMTHNLGYGNWDELKTALRNSPLFRFDWFANSRTPAELARRCDTLVRLIEKEYQEAEQQQHEAPTPAPTPTRKKPSKNGASPSSRSLSSSEKEETTVPSKKRRQASAVTSSAKRRK